MKKVLITLLLIPFLMSAQETQQEPLFMNVTLTPHPTKIAEFEAGLKEHNQQYHSEGANGARVYMINSGENAGKYVWSMGPTAWAAMDGSSNMTDAHMTHWNTKVAPNARANMDITFWKGDAKHSNFTKDFEIKNLSVFYLDMKRFKNQEFTALLDKVHKVFQMKDGDEQWGVYWNQLNNKDGRDMVWINFFDSMSWLGEDDKFPQWYEEVHGEGSFMDFLKEFEATTNDTWTELWMFREDLSGLPGDVVVTSGQ